MKFAVFILSAAFAFAQTPPTSITPAQLTCGPGTSSSAIFVYISLGFGVPATCAQFDAASFFLDKKTSPWTIRVINTGQMVFVDKINLTGVQDGVNTVFTIPDVPVPLGSLTVVRNGIELRLGADFALVGTTLTFMPSAIPQPGDSVSASYRK